ncbi:CYFIP-related Rac1 interactor B isoform 1-T1 [Pangshura tecta]
MCIPAGVVKNLPFLTGRAVERFKGKQGFLFLPRVSLPFIVIFHAAAASLQTCGSDVETDQPGSLGCSLLRVQKPAVPLAFGGSCCLVQRLLRFVLRSRRQTGGQKQRAALAVDAQPTESEKEIYNQVNVVLKDAEGILEDLQSYRGAGHEIREAIQHPTDEKLQEKAWGAVVPLVGKLKKFYEFSQRLEAGLRGLLGALTSTPYSPTQHLEREQALAKQFAEILHFTLRFDELKMTNPAIQNDFSYYRRTLSRMRINNVPAEGENEVNNELANRMSLFYAEATPMLKTLSDATTKFVSENKNLPIENTTDCLSTMASVCRVMLETPEYRSRFTNEETVSFCLRVMVGVIILYDHVHPVGAFAKTSKIDMKGCIKVLKDQPPNSVEGLLNALRYTTKHLNDETTSKQIKSMLQ